MLAFNAMSHRAGADRSRHYYAWDYARNTLDSVPDGSVLLVYGDARLFPQWYVHGVMGFAPSVVVADAWTRLSVDRGPAPGPIRLGFPPERRDLQERYPMLASLLADPGGWVVAVAETFEGLEDAGAVPCGRAYLVAGRGGCARDAERYPRRFRLRGTFTGSALDENTSELLSSYPMGSFRRGRLSARKGRIAGALARYREALSWPPFRGADLAGFHGEAGRCLEAMGDARGALAEYRAGLRFAPASPALKEALKRVGGSGE
jgi:tetratricopeptide (TPR) repeat protein